VRLQRTMTGSRLFGHADSRAGTSHHSLSMRCLKPLSCRIFKGTAFSNARMSLSVRANSCAMPIQATSSFEFLPCLFLRRERN
jgi:hypothetical protein